MRVRSTRSITNYFTAVGAVTELAQAQLLKKRKLPRYHSDFTTRILICICDQRDAQINHKIRESA